MATFLITSPLFPQPGEYRCQQIESTRALRMIRERVESEELLCFVHYQSTSEVLSAATGCELPFVRRPALPTPKTGDVYLSVRLSRDVPKETPPENIGLIDLEFFLIEFTGPEDAIDE